MRTVITGAAGFVGTTLLLGDRLPGDELILVDPAPIDPAVPAALHRRGVPFEIRHSGCLSGAHDPGDADLLLALAGQTDVDQALADPAPAFAANGAIALDAAEWWRRHPAARVVYLSTDEVLGVPGAEPFAEDAPLCPTQPYAASKANAETTLRCYRDTFGMDLTVVRSCNLVGGRQRARKLIPKAVQEMSAGRPVPIVGTGRQTREYLAVEDLGDVLLQASAGALPTGIYHCTSAVAFDVFGVVEVLAAALGLRPELIHVPDRLVQDQAYAMDPGLLRSLGWKPRLSPADAMARAAVEMHAAWRRGEKLVVG